MMSLVVVAGAAMQLPAGRLSDKTDRRFVLAGAAFGAALFAILIFLFEPRSAVFVIVFTAAYGAFAYTLYSIAVAHANDHARDEDFVKVSGGLLLLYGFGTMIGPLLAAAPDGLDAPRRPVPGHRARASLPRRLHAAAHQPPRAGADRKPRCLQDAAGRPLGHPGSIAARPRRKAEADG